MGDRRACCRAGEARRREAEERRAAIVAGEDGVRRLESDAGGKINRISRESSEPPLDSFPLVVDSVGGWGGMLEMMLMRQNTPPDQPRPLPLQVRLISGILNALIGSKTDRSKVLFLLLRTMLLPPCFRRHRHIS